MRTWRNALRFSALHARASPAVLCNLGGAFSHPQHRRDLVEGADARVHFHRLVEAVDVGGRIAAPAAFAYDDRCDIAVEGLADAGLDTAIGGAAADDDRVAPQHV